MTCFDCLNRKTESILAVLTFINSVNYMLTWFEHEKMFKHSLIIQTQNAKHWFPSLNSLNR